MLFIAEKTHKLNKYWARPTNFTSEHRTPPPFRNAGSARHHLEMFDQRLFIIILCFDHDTGQAGDSGFVLPSGIQV